MDKSQFWILTALLEYGCSLPLIDPTRIDWHFASSHGLDRRQLAQTLEQLIARGDIVVEREMPLKQESLVFVPTRSELETLLGGKPPSGENKSGEDEELGEYTDGIFLTSQGGQRWEDVAAPDWNRYLSSYWSGCLRPEWAEDGWEITSADRRLVEHYVSLPDVQACIVPGSEVWDSLAPWEATYWKTLPRGHRVTFRLRTLEDGDLASIPYSAPEPWYTETSRVQPLTPATNGRVGAGMAL